MNNLLDTDEGIDNPLLIKPDALIGNLEEETYTLDEYLGAELILDTGLTGSARRGTVVKRTRGGDGCPIGVASRNPFLGPEAVDKTDGFIQISGSQQQPKNTSPIETAEYDVMSKIDDELAFRLWASHVLQKCKLKRHMPLTERFVMATGSGQ
eukprot:10392529-Ditylum_brightwellii.AAC.1